MCKLGMIVRGIPHILGCALGHLGTQHTQLGSWCTCMRILGVYKPTRVPGCILQIRPHLLILLGPSRDSNAFTRGSKGSAGEGRSPISLALADSCAWPCRCTARANLKVSPKLRRTPANFRGSPCIESLRGLAGCKRDAPRFPSGSLQVLDD